VYYHGLYDVLKLHFKRDEFLIGTYVPRSVSKRESKDNIEDLIRSFLTLQGLISAADQKIDIGDGNKDYPRKVCWIFIVVDEQEMKEELILPNVALVHQKTLAALPPSTLPAAYLRALGEKTPPIYSPFTEEETETLAMTKADRELHFLKKPYSLFQKFPIRCRDVFELSDVFKGFKPGGILDGYLFCVLYYECDKNVEKARERELFLGGLFRELNSFFVNVTFVLAPFKDTNHWSNIPFESDYQQSKKIVPIENGPDVVYDPEKFDPKLAAKFDPAFLFPLMRDVLRLKQRYAATKLPLFNLEKFGITKESLDHVQETPLQRQNELSPANLVGDKHL